MNNRIFQIDFMKVFGILLVVFAHCSRMYTPEGLIHPISDSYSLCSLTRIIYLFHMPMFVFISGFTYGSIRKETNRYDSFVPFFINKSKRLLIPYFFFGLFYVLPFMYLFGFRNDFYDYLIKGIIFSFDSRHLWFVMMLFNLFVLVHFVLSLFRVLKIPYWVSIFCACFIHCAINADRGCVTLIKWDYFQINSTFVYLFFFVIGFNFGYYRSLLNKIILLFSALLFLTLYYLFSNYRFLLVMSIIILIYILSNYFVTLRKNLVFNSLVRNNFGIYLFHPIIIYFFFYYFSSYYINPWLLSLSVFVFSLLISILFTEMFRKLKLNILIGEK